MCEGVRGITGDPYPKGHKHAGKPRFSTPVRWPAAPPAEEHAERRRLHTCPERAAEPWMRTAMAVWHSARVTGLSPVSDLETADPRVLKACQILDHEIEILAMKDREEAKSRAARLAAMKGARGRG
jgi:predicted AAA+ superfamily ATPase